MKLKQYQTGINDKSSHKNYLIRLAYKGLKSTNELGFFAVNINKLMFYTFLFEHQNKRFTIFVRIFDKIQAKKS